MKQLFGAPSTTRVTSPVMPAELEGRPARVTFFTFEDKPCARGVALIVT